MNSRRRFIGLTLAGLIAAGTQAFVPSTAAQEARVSTWEAGDSGGPAISADGTAIAFISTSADRLGSDSNGVADVFTSDWEAEDVSYSSVGPTGSVGNNVSGFPSTSGDGRYVAFESKASDLVGSDTNGKVDVFVRDQEAGTTTLVSISSSGSQGDGDSSFPAISDDGRYVVFRSKATNLVSGDTNGLSDVFAHDLVSGTTTRISVSSSGAQATGSPLFGSTCKCATSQNGRYVLFSSDATNLVPGDTNSTADVFVRDTVTQTTSRVSVSSSGAQATAGPGNPYAGSNPLSWADDISADGRFIVFGSAAEQPGCRRYEQGA